ncbi:hypothetical protein IX95_14910 [Vibrio sp. B183]|uniref:tyrosine-type recombinase/integrase n=1 Tax=Vibrio sp. B183 TaxID=1526762 RepID=UPI000505A2A2|nr:tyrosine-type recombinase/integrase [Vibrio sp. B183]KFI11364.1 hypothetical protein IX95_14910 [Vibrio sp. B183]
MYNVLLIEKTKCLLFDTDIVQPPLLSFRFCLDHLHNKSLNYQKSQLANLKYFYEFWLEKWGCTLDYSFHRLDYSSSAISELTSQLPEYWIYLTNNRILAVNLYKLPSEITHHETITKMQTCAQQYKTACRFIKFLIHTYITYHYTGKTTSELEKIERFLLGKLETESKKYSHYTETTSDSNDLRSLTNEQLVSFSALFKPTPLVNDEIFTKQNYIEYRNYILFILINLYGLRIGEALLLEETSFKSNIHKNKFYMYISNLDNHEDPRIRRPSIKNNYSIRTLEISEQVFYLIKHFYERVKEHSNYGFLFTSSQKNGKPLSYDAVNKIFKKKADIFKKQYPEYFDPKNADVITQLSPHIFRHTWAYRTLGICFNSEVAFFTKAGAVDTKGVMESAKDKLRALGGWSAKSEMPNHYARRFIAEKANTANLALNDQYRDEVVNLPSLH